MDIAEITPSSMRFEKRAPGWVKYASAGLAVLLASVIYTIGFHPFEVVLMIFLTVGIILANARQDLLIDKTTQRITFNEVFFGIAAEKKILNFDGVVDVSLGKSMRWESKMGGSYGEKEVKFGTPVTLEGWDGRKYHNYCIGYFSDRDEATALAKEVCAFIGLEFGTMSPDERNSRIEALAGVA